MNAGDLVLDGNGVAGLLTEAFARDPTTLVRTCQGCGADHALGAHRAYRGAGVVLRCPGCGVTALVVGVLEERFVVELRGSIALPRSPG